MGGTSGRNPVRQVKAGVEAKEQRVRLYDTPTGSYYLPTDAPRDPVIHCIKTGAIFEPEIIETAKAYLRPGSTVLDLGANFGQMSVLFSRFVGAGGEVYSFEADPFVYELLKKTLAANNCQNVTTHRGAVYDRPNQQLFYPVQDFIPTWIVWLLWHRPERKIGSNGRNTHHRQPKCRDPD